MKLFKFLVIAVALATVAVAGTASLDAHVEQVRDVYEELVSHER